MHVCANILMMNGIVSSQVHSLLGLGLGLDVFCTRKCLLPVRNRVDNSTYHVNGIASSQIHSLFLFLL